MAQYEKAQRYPCPHVDTQWVEDSKGKWHQSHAPANHAGCMAARSFGIGAGTYAQVARPLTRKAAPASLFTHYVTPTYKGGVLLSMRKWTRIQIPEVAGE